jgi:peptide-methionine (S)-S-oxide reductase
MGLSPLLLAVKAVYCSVVYHHFVLSASHLIIVDGAFSKVMLSERRWSAYRGLRLRHSKSSHSSSNNNETPNKPIARILNTSSDEESFRDCVRALQNIGFKKVLSGTSEYDADSTAGSTDKLECWYTFSKAAGMLKFVSFAHDDATNTRVEKSDSSNIMRNPPKWVPLISAQENVLVKNGWSFLDVDATEPLSAFDVDAARNEAEIIYTPKWNNDVNDGSDEHWNLSSLGYLLSVCNTAGGKDLVQLGAGLLELTRQVLFNGKTDPRNRKCTHNGHSFAGSVEQSVIPQGIFCTALGDLPVFATCDLSPTTASSGWLSFVNPISEDHILLVENENDNRIEVICARTRLHLGHYFGRGRGYCINASALNFYPLLLPSKDHDQYCLPVGARPTSWITLLHAVSTPSSGNSKKSIDPAWQLLHHTLKILYVENKNTGLITIALGAGCFWHVEFALRRLPGIISTQVGFAGGHLSYPTYDQVCNQQTGHAEVVLVQFDSDICPCDVLMDCFFAMHNPTISRAHGKRSKGAGQYRSCIFTTSTAMRNIALEAIHQCKKQLNKSNETAELSLSTEVIFIDDTAAKWFWRAEEKHQLHDERVKAGKADITTVSFSKWLKYYGRWHFIKWGY